MCLSKRLKELRKEKNILQKEVADYLKTNLTTYASYEQGRSEPNYDTLILLSDFFNVSTDYLLGKSNVKARQSEVEFMKDIENKTIDQMIHEYNITLQSDEKMSEEDERKLIRIIKMFLEKE